MNALVGQEAKANFSLFWLIRSKGADDGSRKDGGDFANTGAGAHLADRFAVILRETPLETAYRRGQL